MPVEVGDLKLAARRRLERWRDLDDLVVVEVEAGHGPVGSRLLRLLLDRDALGRRRRTRRRRNAADLSRDSRRSSRRLTLARVARQVRPSRGRRRCCRQGPAATGSPPMKSAPMMKACARPSGSGCRRSVIADAEVASRHRAAARTAARSWGVEITQDVADAGQHQGARADSRSSACRRPASAAC